MEQYRAEQFSRHIGILGGTFDPVHYGHLVIAEEVLAELHLDEIIFIPTGQPPHKPEQETTAALHRVAMLELAIASNPYFSLSRTEVNRAGLSYTADTLRQLRASWGAQVAIAYIIGWDSLEEFHTWHEPQEILAQLTWLVAVQRPGHTETTAYLPGLEVRLPGLSQRLKVVAAPQLAISASDLRHRVSAGKPIKYQVPEAVEEYILQHKLYTNV